MENREAHERGAADPKSAGDLLTVRVEMPSLVASSLLDRPSPRAVNSVRWRTVRCARSFPPFSVGAASLEGSFIT